MRVGRPRRMVWLDPNECMDGMRENVVELKQESEKQI